MGKLDDRRERAQQGQAAQGGKLAQRRQSSTPAKRTPITRDSDIAALTSGKPEEVKDWKDMAALTIQLSMVADQDPQTKEMVNSMLWSYGDKIKPHTDALGGEEWWTQNFQEQPKEDKPWWAPIASGAEGVFGYLDQWGLSARSAIAGVESALTDDGLSAGDGIRHAVRQGTRALDVTRAVPGFDGISQYMENVDDPTVIRDSANTKAKLLDQDGDGGLNLREAVGVNVDGGGKAAGVLDFIGSALLDPSTYATFGQSALAKTGMRGVEEAAERLGREGLEGMTRETAEELNQIIVRKGFKALEPEQQRLYSGLLRSANEMAVEAGGRATTRFGKDLVEEQFKAIYRGGQSGLKLGGVTVRSGEKLGDLGRATGLLSDVVYGKAVLGDADDLAVVVRESVQQGLVGKLREIPAVEKLMGSLDLYGAVKARFGTAVSDSLREAMSVTRSQESEVKEIMVRMGADMHKDGLLKQAIEEVGDQETLERAMNQLLAQGGKLQLVSDVGGESSQRLFETMLDVRQEIYQTTLRGMGYSGKQIADIVSGEMPPPANLRNINEYIPRILTDAVRNDSKLLGEIRNLSDDASKDMIGGGVSDGFLQRRGIARSMDDLFESNEEAKRIFEYLDIETPEQLFETNVPAALVARSQSAFRAAADVDLLDKLSDLTGPGGIPLGFRAEGGERLTADAVGEQLIKDAGGRLADYRKVTLPNGTVYRIHEELAKPLEEVRRIFGDPKEVSAFGKFFDKMNNLWAVMATVGGVNPGFHARNTVGNMFNAFLGGTRDPAVFTRAGKLQTTDRSIREAMRKGGQTFEEAAASLDLDPSDIRILKDAKRLGVIGDGRSLDILRETAGQDGAVSKTGNRLNPMSDKSVLTAPGRAVGNTVEGNARLGVYIDQINKGATADAAAAHVKKYLFDYGDLTRFESETLRRGARFYTFTRKNTALQMYALSQYPGRVGNAEETVDQLLELFTGDADEEGSQQLPPWMQDADVRNIGGKNAAVDIDTPFSSFTDTIGLVSPLIPDNSPEAKFQEQEGFVSKLDGLFSGVGVSVLDFLEEQRTGKDAFTGRTLTPPGTLRDGKDVGKLRDHWLFRAVDTVAPVASRFERQGRKLGVGADGEDEEPLALALANILAGVQTYELGDGSESSSRYVIENTLEESLQVLRDKGIPAPTLAEAREMGEIALKDRVVEAIMYSWEENEDGELVWSDSMRDDRLLNVMSKGMREAMGLPEPTTGAGSGRGARPDTVEGSAEALAIGDFDDAQMMSAVEEYLGRTLSDEERSILLLSMPGSPSKAFLEDEGIEPERTTNRFEPEAEADEEAKKAATLDAFERRAENVGISVDYLREMRPRMSDFERLLTEAEEAGVAHEDLLNHIMYAKDEGGGGILSRNDKAYLNVIYGGDAMNGPFAITGTRTPEFTEEDAEKARERAWQTENEMRLVADLFDLPAPTDTQVKDYILNVQMTGGELDTIGEPNLPNAKNRKDIRSDAQKYEDAMRERNASLSGIRFGASE